MAGRAYFDGDITDHASARENRIDGMPIPATRMPRLA
jgi:hypothetical protein